MFKARINSTSGSDAFGHATAADVSPIEDAALHCSAVIPWLLRGKGGNLDKGVEVIVERFVDGSAMILSRADGDFGGVVYAQTLMLGDDAGTDFVALAQKVQDALTDVQTAFTQHSHPATSGTTSPTTTMLWGGVSTLVPSVAASNVKAK